MLIKTACPLLMAPKKLASTANERVTRYRSLVHKILKVPFRHQRRKLTLNYISVVFKDNCTFSNRNPVWVLFFFQLSMQSVTTSSLKDSGTSRREASEGPDHLHITDSAVRLG